VLIGVPLNPRIEKFAGAPEHDRRRAATHALMLGLRRQR
jgi:hypothetical protein